MEVLIYALLSAWGKSIGDRVTSIGWPTINNARAAGDTRLTLDRCVSGFNALCIWPMMSAIDCSKRLSRPSRWDAICTCSGSLDWGRAWSYGMLAGRLGSLDWCGASSLRALRWSEAAVRGIAALRLKIDGLLVPYTTLVAAAVAGVCVHGPLHAQESRSLPLRRVQPGTQRPGLRDPQESGLQR